MKKAAGWPPAPLGGDDLGASDFTVDLAQRKSKKTEHQNEIERVRNQFDFDDDVCEY